MEEIIEVLLLHSHDSHVVNNKYAIILMCSIKNLFEITFLNALKLQQQVKSYIFNFTIGQSKRYLCDLYNPLNFLINLVNIYNDIINLN